MISSSQRALNAKTQPLMKREKQTEPLIKREKQIPLKQTPEKQTKP